jgi:hypothetical protein
MSWLGVSGSGLGNAVSRFRKLLRLHGRCRPLGPGACCNPATRDRASPPGEALPEPNPTGPPTRIKFPRRPPCQHCQPLRRSNRRQKRKPHSSQLHLWLVLHSTIYRIVPRPILPRSTPAYFPRPGTKWGSRAGQDRLLSRPSEGRWVLAFASRQRREHTRCQLAGTRLNAERMTTAQITGQATAQVAIALRTDRFVGFKQEKRTTMPAKVTYRFFIHIIHAMDKLLKCSDRAVAYGT